MQDVLRWIKLALVLLFPSAYYVASVVGTGGLLGGVTAALLRVSVRVGVPLGVGGAWALVTWLPYRRQHRDVRTICLVLLGAGFGSAFGAVVGPAVLNWSSFFGSGVGAFAGVLGILCWKLVVGRLSLLNRSGPSRDELRSSTVRAFAIGVVFASAPLVVHGAALRIVLGGASVALLAGTTRSANSLLSRSVVWAVVFGYLAGLLAAGLLVLADSGLTELIGNADRQELLERLHDADPRLALAWPMIDDLLLVVSVLAGILVVHARLQRRPASEHEIVIAVHDGVVSDLVVSRDQTRLVSASGSGEVVVRDTRDLRELSRFTIEGGIFDLSLSADGQSLLTCETDRTWQDFVRVRTTDTGQLIAEHPVGQGQDVHALAFGLSPTTFWELVIDQEQTLTLSERAVETGETLRSVEIDCMDVGRNQFCALLVDAERERIWLECADAEGHCGFDISDPMSIRKLPGAAEETPREFNERIATVADGRVGRITIDPSRLVIEHPSGAEQAIRVRPFGQLVAIENPVRFVLGLHDGTLRVITPPPLEDDAG